MFLANRLPSFSQLIEALPEREPGQLCKYLDITHQTLRRWKAAQTAPRMAMLAMYWETPYGASLVNTTAHNGAMYARQEVCGLKAENAMLHARIARLEGLGNFGSANEPMLSFR
jgi:hypothetical protein